jgi:hypothetical protein
MSDVKPLHRVIEELPESNLTTTLLHALDYVVPGEWKNVTVFDQMIREVTGESDEGLIQQIGERSLALYGDSNQGYQRAVWLFQAVDSVDVAAGAAAMANKVGESFSFFGLLESVTPKADTTQAVDAAIKLAAELSAFCLTNGIPGDSVGDFVSSLANYGKEDVMRMAAYVSFDLLLPLGPDFLEKMISGVQTISEEYLGQSSLFQKVAYFLPGSIGEQKTIIEKNVGEASGYLQNFVQSRGMSREGVLETVRKYVEVADDKLDYVAAAIDVSTSYFAHTGVQTVARRIISRAYGEI